MPNLVEVNCGRTGTALATAVEIFRCARMFDHFAKKKENEIKAESAGES
jgi:hypothetical protein